MSPIDPNNLGLDFTETLITGDHLSFDGDGTFLLGMDSQGFVIHGYQHQEPKKGLVVVAYDEQGLISDFSRGAALELSSVRRLQCIEREACCAQFLSHINNAGLETSDCCDLLIEDQAKEPFLGLCLDQLSLKMPF